MIDFLFFLLFYVVPTALVVGLVVFLVCVAMGGVPESLKCILPKAFVAAVERRTTRPSQHPASQQSQQAASAQREASRQQSEWMKTMEGRLQAQARALTDLHGQVSQLTSQLDDVKRQLAIAMKPAVAPSAPQQPAAPVRKPTYPYVRYAQVATAKQPAGFATDDLNEEADRSAFRIKVGSADSATYELTTNVEAVRRVLLSLNFYGHLLDVDNQTHGELQHVRMTAAGRLKREGDTWGIIEKLKLIIS